MNAVVLALKGLGLYLIKKYAASLAFDAIMEASEKAAKQTNTQVDDDIVAKVKADKEAILSFFK